MFDTYGPFVWAKHDAKGFKDLFAEVDDADGKLGRAMGVYLFVATTEDGRKIPVYVGQTYKTFWGRLNQHFKSHKFADLLSKRPLEIFLIARRTGKKFRFSTKKVCESRGLKSIDWLELQLIDHCRELNDQLLNIHEKAFHSGLLVPGFRDKGFPREPAAKALGKILKR